MPESCSRPAFFAAVAPLAVATPPLVGLALVVAVVSSLVAVEKTR